MTWRRMLHAASTCAAQQRMPATAGHALRSRQEREQAQPSLLLKQCPAALPMAGHCWVPAAGGKPEPFTGTWRASPVPARARCWPPPATGTKKVSMPARISKCSRGGMETLPSAERQEGVRHLAEGITFCLVRIRPPDGALLR